MDFTPARQTREPVAPVTDVEIDIRSKLFREQGKAQQHLAIKDLKLRLGDGEFSCLIGPSGCGKTTSLHILAGLDTEYQGTIRFGSSNQKPKIGYVFQEPRLLPWRNVRENIDLVLDQERTHEPVDRLLSTLGLDRVQEVYPERLSLGMSRRVALARAFAIQPDLLLMDEPFVSLDAANARKARNLLARVWQQRSHTVLFVTHDLREAITLADRLIFLSPAPARVVCDIPVAIDRNDRSQESKIEEFRRRLLSEQPAIRDLL